MARIFTKELLLNPNTDSFKKSINDMRYNAASENRKQWATGIYDVAKSLGDVGKAFYENKQRQDRLASIDDTDLEYRNDPVWIAAKDEYARTGDSSKLNAVKAQFVAEAQAKAKQDEIDAMKAKAKQDAIEAAQLEYTQNMGTFDEYGDIRNKNAAEKAALNLKQLGAEVKEYIPKTKSGKYKFQEVAEAKARAEQEAEEEKEYAEKEAAFDKEKAEKEAKKDKEEAEIIASEKKKVEHHIETYNQEVRSARNIKNKAKRKAKLKELSEKYKDLTTVADLYGIDKLPEIINEDEYTADKVTYKPTTDGKYKKYVNGVFVGVVEKEGE